MRLHCRALEESLIAKDQMLVNITAQLEQPKSSHSPGEQKRKGVMRFFPSKPVRAGNKENVSPRSQARKSAEVVSHGQHHDSVDGAKFTGPETKFVFSTTEDEKKDSLTVVVSHAGETGDQGSSGEPSPQNLAVEHGDMMEQTFTGSQATEDMMEYVMVDAPEYLHQLQGEMEKLRDSCIAYRQQNTLLNQVREAVMCQLKL